MGATSKEIYYYYTIIIVLLYLCAIVLMYNMILLDCIQKILDCIQNYKPLLTINLTAVVHVVKILPVRLAWISGSIPSANEGLVVYNVFIRCDLMVCYLFPYTCCHGFSH